MSKRNAPSTDGAVIVKELDRLCAMNCNKIMSFDGKGEKLKKLAVSIVRYRLSVCENGPIESPYQV